MSLVPKPRCLHGQPWDRCQECRVTKDFDEETPTVKEVAVPMSALVDRPREGAGPVVARTKTKTWPPRKDVP